MTDAGTPSDPFGDSDRTVIRPTPAGTKPAPAAPPSSDPPARNPPSRSEPAPPIGATIIQPSRAPRAPDHPPTDQILAPNENAILRLAIPLLTVLGRLRTGSLRADIASLKETIAAGISRLEGGWRAAGVSPEQAGTAKVALCITADDVLRSLPQGEATAPHDTILARVAGERARSVNLIAEIERLKADPAAHYALLEFLHACLALGLSQSQGAIAGGGHDQAAAQRGIHEALRAVKGTPPEFSPQWQGQPIAQSSSRFTIPVWAVGSIAATLLVATFVALRVILGGASDAAAASLVAVHPAGEVNIQRLVPAPPPPPPPPTVQRVSVCAGISAPMSCLETPTSIVIRLSNMPLFDPLDAKLKDSFKPDIARVAQVLERQPGAIKIVGHTDDMPVKTARFSSNFQLSVERAKAVTALIKPALSQPNRVEASGQGADVPIASNSTPEGRAANRRIEIIIKRTN